MIDISNLNFYYGSSQILFDVSLKAKNKEITCLMGSNGVGKTSLLKFLSGIYPSKSGNYPVSYTHLTLPTIYSV